MARHSFIASQVFDGTRFCQGALVVEGGRIAALGSVEGPVTDLGPGVLMPGLVDLQINGAGGRAVNGDLDMAGLDAICRTQIRLGTTACLPTLISDSAEATAHVIALGIRAAQAGMPGFLGLHLEGPHLDPRRKGAHPAAALRPMEAADLDRLLAAARALPHLMVTLAPSAATPDQIAALAAAGVIVSLGHSDCTAAEADAAFAAGARCVTHLFNAMSPLGSREPGLVGATLASDIPAGLIADGLHVDPRALKIALAARPEGLFLVSDCMELQGTDARDFTLAGRRILRTGGRLVLEDGTLAGADLTLPRAIALLTGTLGLPMETALAMATSVPAGVIGAACGRLAPGLAADFIHLAPGGEVTGVWKDGLRVS